MPRSIARTVLLASLSLLATPPVRASERVGELGYAGPRRPVVVHRSVGRPPPRAVLIQGYLPRLTEKPMYNEPPNRFPAY